MDWLPSLFLGTFLFGLLFCVGTILLGVGDSGPDDLDLSADGPDGLDGGEPAPAGTQVSPWNLTALTAFVAWFGGVGYLALTAWQLALGVSLLAAVVAGVFGWAVVYWFYARVLGRAKGRMDAADYQLEGTVARVTVPIAGDRSGEIQFSRDGARRSEGARSADGTAIPRGTEVVVVKYERGIAYVQPWEAYVEPAAPEGRQGGI